MMRTRGLLAFALAFVASQASALQHDLFARPALEVLKPATPTSVKSVTPSPPPDWKPELRAIIAGDGSAIVNVEGRIVQMGQDIEGYRLVEVKERQATFARDKVRYTLFLKPVNSAEATPAPSRSAQPAPAESRGLGTLKTSDVLSSPPAANAAAGGAAGPVTAAAGAADRRRE
jgi:hypothetical protein